MGRKQKYFRRSSEHLHGMVQRAHYDEMDWMRYGYKHGGINTTKEDISQELVVCGAVKKGWALDSIWR